ncbi:proline oxidase [Dactylonectria estremocensis]|uniref:Proline dehydrogenase n=1 Tax=Dactylonectria estremocensis TaxID=1079267 RepID=A0A9P9FJ79_9HYPO|nr:proline oxidase [Dactylonectria estremocensis]
MSTVLYYTPSTKCGATLTTIRPLGTALRPKIRKNALLQGRFGSTSRHITAELPSTLEPASPLAALPASVLWRSIFINSITSKPYLLRPSLWVLSKLSNPGRFMPSIDNNILLKWILKPTFYKQFCAGETGPETQATMKHLKEMGFRGTILTYAKEIVFDHATGSQHGLGVNASTSAETQWCESIEAWRVGTLNTVELLGEGDQLAVKLTGAGALVTKAFCEKRMPPQQMIDAMDEISAMCKQRGAYILVDAESQHFQWGIAMMSIYLMKKYNTDGYAVIYNTYQAYLKSTSDTLAKHLAAAAENNFTLGLKLVRGAYLASDERCLIHDTKDNTDDAYNCIAQGALKQQIGSFGAPNGRPFPSVNLLLASHNKESVMTAHRLHQARLQANLPTVPVKFAQLQGMSDEVSFGLLQLKGGPNSAPEVYKCSTWGTVGECLAYLVRRALENRDAASRTRDEYVALKSEAWRRLRAIF